MESNSKSGIIALVIGLLVIGGGAAFLLTNNSDDEAETTTSEVVQQDEAPAVANDIVALASSVPSLSTLVTAVETAGLVGVLQSEGPFTVLAPDDDAFASALAELNITAEQLLAREDLGAILTYHVIAGSVFSSDLTDGQVVETVNTGTTLTVSITDEGVFFVDQNGRQAQVTTADVEASNGVVHIINNVLLP